MNIFKKFITMLKNIFVKKEEIVMLEEAKENLDNEKNKFKESLRVKIERITNGPKKVETNICYGDGLGIKPKMEA